jgi:hypothetical protein
MQNTKLLIAIVTPLFISSCTSVELIKPVAVKTIQLEPLKAETSETGIVITDAISNELTKQGFSIIKDKADMKLVGSVAITEDSFWETTPSWVSSVVIQGLNQSGEIFLTGCFNQGFASKTPAEIGKELGKNIAKKLK